MTLYHLKQKTSALSHKYRSIKPLKHRFQQAMRNRRERDKDHVLARQLIHQARTCELTELVNRLVNIYAPTLFRCYMYSTHSELWQCSDIISLLVKETDEVIKGDLRFREELMDNLSGHIQC